MADVKLPKFGGKTGGDDYNDRFEEFISIILSTILFGTKQKDFKATESKATINDKKKSLMGMIEDQNNKLNFIAKYLEEKKKQDDKDRDALSKSMFSSSSPEKTINEIIVTITSKGNLQALNDLVEFCQEVSKDGDKNVKRALETIGAFTTLIDSIIALSEKLPSIAKTIMFNVKLSLMLATMLSATEYINDKKTIENIEAADKFIPTLQKFSHGLSETIKNMSSAGENAGILQGIINLYSINLYLKGINKNVDYINKHFDLRKLKMATNRMEHIEKFAVSIKNTTKAISIAGALATVAVVAMVPITVFLLAFWALKKLADKLFGKDDKTMASMAAVGSMSTGNGISKSDKGTGSSKDGFVKMALSIAIIGLTLLFAGMVVSLVDMGKLFKFVVTLGIFMLAMAGIMKLVSSGFDEKGIEAMKNFMSVVIICGVIMLVGAALMYIPGLIENAFLFTAVLSLFIIGVSIPFLFFKIVGNIVLKQVKYVMALVILSGALLLIGAYMLMEYPELKGYLYEFTAILLGFIGALCTIYAIFGKFCKSSLKSAYNLAILVGVSALALTLGPILLSLRFGTSVGDMATAGLYVAGFGLILWGFIKLILKSVNSLTKNSAKIAISQAAMIGLAILIGAATAAITLGPIALNLAGVELIEVAKFAAVLLATVGGFILVAKIIDKAKTSITKALIPAGMMILIATALTGCVAVLVNLIPKVEGKYGTLYGLLLFMGIMVGSLTAAIFGLGMISMNPVFWAGVAAMGTISLIALTLSIATMNIANALNIIKDIPEDVLETAPINIARVVGLMFAAIGGLLTGKMVLMKADGSQEVINCGKIEKEYLESGFLSTSPFGVLVNNATKIGDIISNIAEGLKGYAELKLPTGFKSDGTPAGFRPFKDSDFNSAAINMARIVGLMFLAIGGLITGQMNLPDSRGNITTLEITPLPIWALRENMFIDSPFTVLINNATKIGDIISNISKGLQDYALLKIPTGFDPKTGEPTGFTRMTDKTFTDAAKNIAAVVTGMFVPFINMANGNFDPSDSEFTKLVNKHEFEEFFHEGWFNDSPAQLLLKNASKLGGIISSLTNAMKDYADFRVPDKWDEKGNPIHYERIDLNKVIPNATANITKIVTSMFGIMMDIAKDPKMQKIQKTAVEKTQGFMSAMVPMTTMLANVSDIIGSYASGKFCKYNEKGEEIPPVFNITDDNIKIARENMRKTVDCMLGMFTDTQASISEHLGDYKSIADLIDPSNHENGLKQMYDDFKGEDDTADLAKYTEALAKAQKNNNEAYVQGTIGVLLSVINGLKTISGAVKDIIEETSKIDIGSSLYERQGYTWLTKNIHDILHVGTKNILRVTGGLTSGTRLFTKDQLKITQEKFKSISDLISDEIDLFAKLGELNEKQNNSVNKNNGRSPIATLSDDLAKFSIKISGLNTNKMNTVIKLANAVEKMGAQFGGIDRLVNAITNKLTVVLVKLISQLNASATTINKAEKIQATRHALIKEAIKSIDGLMKQQINVMIRQEDSSTPGGSPGGSPSDSLKPTTPLTGAGKDKHNPGSNPGSGG